MDLNVTIGEYVFQIRKCNDRKYCPEPPVRETIWLPYPIFRDDHKDHYITFVEVRTDRETSPLECQQSKKGQLYGTRNTIKKLRRAKCLLSCTMYILQEITVYICYVCRMYTRKMSVVLYDVHPAGNYSVYMLCLPYVYKINVCCPVRCTSCRKLQCIYAMSAVCIQGKCLLSCTMYILQEITVYICYVCRMYTRKMSVVLYDVHPAGNYSVYMLCLPYVYKENVCCPVRCTSCRKLQCIYAMSAVCIQGKCLLSCTMYILQEITVCICYVCRMYTR